MIGNKLYNLIKELSPLQLKILISECNNSNDKRLLLLNKYLSKNENSLAYLNKFFDNEVYKMWPESSESENELKIRRLANYYSLLIEKILIDDYMEKNSSIRNIILANIVIKKGNVELVNYYYDKAYQKSLKEEDASYQIKALRGKSRMMYASQNDKKTEKIFQYNKELIDLAKNNYDSSIAEYYYNISNIYLEKNSLIIAEKDKYISEIEYYLSTFDNPLLLVSLHMSLGKLNFNNNRLLTHFVKAKQLLGTIPIKDKAYYDLSRKLDFLELRLNFFNGKKLGELIEITKRIFGQSDDFSIINNNTIFYKVLFDILDGRLEESLVFLEKNNLYFRGESKMLEQFLRAVIFEKKGEYKKAIQLLQTIIYSSNYFFSIFSRLLLIKIYVEYDYSSVLKSLIESTQRYLILNNENPLGMESHRYVLSILKNKKMKTTQHKVIEIPKLTVFHQYLLE